MTELAVTEHLFRFRQADALLGGFWDDPRVSPALAESMARVLEVPRHRRPRRLRGVRARGQGGRAADRHRARGRLLRGPDGHGGRPAGRLPLRRPAGVGALGRRAGASTTSTTRRPWRSGRPARSTPAGTPTPRPWRSWPPRGACDVLAHPDLIKVAGHVPDAPAEWWDRIAEAAAAVGHGGRGVLGRAGASPSASSTRPPGLLDRFVARGVPLTTASDAHRLEHVADRADDLRGRARPPPAPTRCRRYRGRVGLRGAVSSPAGGRAGDARRA